MLDFNHLLTTRPHSVQQILISDLHLSADEPALVQAFLALLDDCLALPALSQLYILGDWFEVWLGDDMYTELDDDAKAAHWLTPIVKRLKALRVAGCDILVMHGNRDFLLGRPFCHLFGARLIAEPFYTDIGGTTVRLEHGDALCTDDVKYQWFRKVTRKPLVQWYFLKKPITKRHGIADRMRAKSKQQNAQKSAAIMDVNNDAVQQALQNAVILMHGHTHRPAKHEVKTTASAEPVLSEHKWRYVLGDWRIIDSGSKRAQVQAVIAAVTESADSTALDLYQFCHRVR